MIEYTYLLQQLLRSQISHAKRSPKSSKQAEMHKNHRIHTNHTSHTSTSPIYKFPLDKVKLKLLIISNAIKAQFIAY